MTSYTPPSATPTTSMAATVDNVGNFRHCIGNSSHKLGRPALLVSLMASSDSSIETVGGHASSGVQLLRSGHVLPSPPHTKQRSSSCSEPTIPSQPTTPASVPASTKKVLPRDTIMSYTGSLSSRTAYRTNEGKRLTLRATSDGVWIAAAGTWATTRSSK